jgi:hypothetical protein
MRLLMVGLVTGPEATGFNAALLTSSPFAPNCVVRYFGGGVGPPQMLTRCHALDGRSGPSGVPAVWDPVPRGGRRASEQCQGSRATCQSPPMDDRSPGQWRRHSMDGWLITVCDGRTKEFLSPSSCLRAHTDLAAFSGPDLELRTRPKSQKGFLLRKHKHTTPMNLACLPRAFFIIIIVNLISHDWRFCPDKEMMPV